MAKNSPQDKENRIYFSNKLNELLDIHNKKQIDLHRDLNIPKSTITGYVKGTSLPTSGNVQKIADYFGIKKSELDIRFQNDIFAPTSTLTLITDTASQLNEDRQLVVLNTAEDQLEEQNRKVYEIHEELHAYEITEKLAAASGLPSGYSYDSDHNQTYTLYSDKQINTRYDIASEVTGDSMEPLYKDGDIVLIQKGYNNVNGAVYAVDYDGKTYLKKVYLENNQFRLVSINDKYDDIYINLPVDEGLYFNIVGKVVDSFTPVVV
ncbi:helix-turn-helix transcriptional regulator [Aerococcaceae bacterium zg-ZJ1578]|uniref:LexA family transcriptional regulator n=1 Tax=Aerococcaceae bacterium zg-252 TaxID=2796928 RepID=UPI001A3195E7|nr:helix-turn-helix transcriptional regulator [Aerococcaceae bacterium zg-1578]